MLRVWLIVPPDDVKRSTRDIQAAFRHLDWIAPVPDHFLHVSVAVEQRLDVDSAARAWTDVQPFRIVYRRVNCFHDALIVEAHTAGVAALVERALPDADLSVLPHLSIGYTRRSELADPLRVGVLPLCDIEVGSGVVERVLLCDVPVAKSTFLQPWRILGSVKLRG